MINNNYSIVGSRRHRKTYRLDGIAAGLPGHIKQWKQPCPLQSNQIILILEFVPVSCILNLQLVSREFYEQIVPVTLTRMNH